MNGNYRRERAHRMQGKEWSLLMQWGKPHIRSVETKDKKPSIKSPAPTLCYLTALSFGSLYSHCPEVTLRVLLGLLLEPPPPRGWSSQSPQGLQLATPNTMRWISAPHTGGRFGSQLSTPNDSEPPQEVRSLLQGDTHKLRGLI